MRKFIISYRAEYTAESKEDAVAQLLTYLGDVVRLEEPTAFDVREVRVRTPKAPKISARSREILDLMRQGWLLRMGPVGPFITAPDSEGSRNISWHTARALRRRALIVRTPAPENDSYWAEFTAAPSSQPTQAK